MNELNLYRVFMLRLWQEADSAASKPGPLRIVLEEPHSGERCSFASLEALLAYLEEIVEAPQPNDIAAEIQKEHKP
ncbi:MAG: hypothetical protein EOM24_21325 [Chloroflexia bacterium]|nr:hypothetical protein [Chloroflexia bacterium]